MENNKEMNIKEERNETEQTYSPYNIKCPQKLWENRITTNCEDVPRWKELIMEGEKDMSEEKICKTLSDKETCNPKICRWCKYSNNGKRDPARSITMCDGCRYNEEFVLITEDKIQ